MIPCADDIDDFDKFYEFVSFCSDYDVDDSRCLYLADFAEDCLSSTTIDIEEYCELYVWNVGYEDDDTVEACAMKVCVYKLSWVYVLVYIYIYSAMRFCINAFLCQCVFMYGCCFCLLCFSVLVIVCYTINIY